MTAILKAGGGPENMVTIMEGEALLNDASAVTLYTGAHSVHMGFEDGWLEGYQKRRCDGGVEVLLGDRFEVHWWLAHASIIKWSALSA